MASQCSTPDSLERALISLLQPRCGLDTSAIISPGGIGLILKYQLDLGPNNLLLKLAISWDHFGQAFIRAAHEFQYPLCLPVLASCLVLVAGNKWVLRECHGSNCNTYG